MHKFLPRLTEHEPGNFTLSLQHVADSDYTTDVRYLTASGPVFADKVYLTTKYKDEIYAIYQETIGSELAETVDASTMQIIKVPILLNVNNWPVKGTRVRTKRLLQDLVTSGIQIKILASLLVLETDKIGSEQQLFVRLLLGLVIDAVCETSNRDIRLLSDTVAKKLAITILSGGWCRTRPPQNVADLKVRLDALAKLESLSGNPEGDVNIIAGIIRGYTKLAASPALLSPTEPVVEIEVSQPSEALEPESPLKEAERVVAPPIDTLPILISPENVLAGQKAIAEYGIVGAYADLCIAVAALIEGRSEPVQIDKAMANIHRAALAPHEAAYTQFFQAQMEKNDDAMTRLSYFLLKELNPPIAAWNVVFRGCPPPQHGCEASYVTRVEKNLDAMRPSIESAESLLATYDKTMYKDVLLNLLQDTQSWDVSPPTQSDRLLLRIQMLLRRLGVDMPSVRPVCYPGPQTIIPNMFLQEAPLSTISEQFKRWAADVIATCAKNKIGQLASMTSLVAMLIVYVKELTTKLPGPFFEAHTNLVKFANTHATEWSEYTESLWDSKWERYTLVPWGSANLLDIFQPLFDAQDLISSKDVQTIFARVQTYLASGYPFAVWLYDPTARPKEAVLDFDTLRNWVRVLRLYRQWIAQIIPLGHWKRIAVNLATILREWLGSTAQNADLDFFEQRVLPLYTKEPMSDLEVRKNVIDRLDEWLQQPWLVHDTKLPAIILYTAYIGKLHPKKPDVYIKDERHLALALPSKFVDIVELPPKMEEPTTEDVMLGGVEETAPVEFPESSPGKSETVPSLGESTVTPVPTKPKISRRSLSEEEQQTRNSAIKLAHIIEKAVLADEVAQLKLLQEATVVILDTTVVEYCIKHPNMMPMLRETLKSLSRFAKIYDLPNLSTFLTTLAKNKAKGGSAPKRTIPPVILGPYEESVPRILVAELQPEVTSSLIATQMVRANAIQLVQKIESSATTTGSTSIESLHTANELASVAGVADYILQHRRMVPVGQKVLAQVHNDAEVEKLTNLARLLSDFMRDGPKRTPVSAPKIPIVGSLPDKPASVESIPVTSPEIGTGLMRLIVEKYLDLRELAAFAEITLLKPVSWSNMTEVLRALATKDPSDATLLKLIDMVSRSIELLHAANIALDLTLFAEMDQPKASGGSNKVILGATEELAIIFV